MNPLQLLLQFAPSVIKAIKGKENIDETVKTVVKDTLGVHSLDQAFDMLSGDKEKQQQFKQAMEKQAMEKHAMILDDVQDARKYTAYNNMRTALTGFILFLLLGTIIGIVAIHFFIPEVDNTIATILGSAFAFAIERVKSAWRFYFGDSLSSDKEK